MKRFYCNKCSRVIRVRHLPTIISNPQSNIPTHRVGECNWHHSSGSRLLMFHRSHPVKLFSKKSTPVATSKTTKKSRKQA
jgi:hypothetical protein